MQRAPALQLAVVCVYDKQKLCDCFSLTGILKHRINLHSTHLHFTLSVSLVEKIENIFLSESNFDCLYCLCKRNPDGTQGNWLLISKRGFCL